MANIVDIHLTIDDQYQWRAETHALDLTERSMKTLLKALKAIESIPQCYFDTMDVKP